MAGSETRLRRSRADFERNRSEILESAEKRFSKEGVGTSLEAVARDAGVGSATLYRHFPTRDALLAELLSRRESQLLSEKHRIEQIVDSGSALEQWMAALEDFFGAFEGLPGPLRSAFLEEHNPLAVSCTGFIELTGQFLGAAQRDGKAHSWLRARDLFLAALALSWVRGSSLADESSQQHLRALSRDGYASTNEAP
ncbi:TetR/AcrR family transcriptional regulator [Rhodococcus sp. IEGM 1307]|uniref:TetR/AcrR family transcriptional regulator n=1 Tax=Rhodococcus sp. IEGM 1307 TaxID=3047091 RepID=UPI0024B725FC|nr:TetR/AcrR family transcriptional regulator [Rhodococcus sp. IEGM 1307]MDI9977219.1 helix-turn-helix domain-containing protein [Rhodococcus sp. IEGM 1307]